MGLDGHVMYGNRNRRMNESERLRLEVDLEWQSIICMEFDECSRKYPDMSKDRCTALKMLKHGTAKGMALTRCVNSAGEGE